MNVVRTCVSLDKSQKDFLKDSPYSLSKIVQTEINKLMKNSEGQDLHSQPTDESSGEDSNG